jgi:antitoxin CptB
MVAPTSSDAWVSGRTYWQCRRGMLELDALLQEFLNSGYAELGTEERKTFDVLLTYHDNLLLDYLMGRTVSADLDTAHVVEKIRRSIQPHT